MLPTAWIDRSGKIYLVENDTHAQKAKELCGEKYSAFDSEIKLEEDGWIRARHGVPFYGSYIFPTEEQKKIVVEAYYDDQEHYRDVCKKGAYYMFALFFDDEDDIKKLKNGLL